MDNILIEKLEEAAIYTLDVGDAGLFESAAAKITELEKALVAPTDSGVVELDKICEKFNSTGDYSLTNLVCLVWNKAFFEALKEQG